ncbi:MAG: hypothetical protein PUG15_04220 [Bacteroidales bacterium]|nr:hypothetical protein [Bacteroidales bacterium]
MIRWAYPTFPSFLTCAATAATIASHSASASSAMFFEKGRIVIRFDHATVLRK